MYSVGDKVKLDDYGQKQWPDANTLEIIEIDSSIEKYGSGVGLKTNSEIIPYEFVDSDYFIPA